jgi:hypothetical protein
MDPKNFKNIDAMKSQIIEGFKPGRSTVQGASAKETAADEKELNFGLNLIVEDEVYQKVMHWVNKSNFEVSGLGNIVFEPETNTLRVIDAILLKQENTSTTTDIDPSAINKAMFDLRNAPGELKWWWHSHVNMPVFWSGTDIATIKQLGGGGWFAATVFNKKQEMLSGFCQANPVRMLVPKIPDQVERYVDAAKVAEWDRAYELNVKNLSYTTRYYSAKDDKDSKSVIHHYKGEHFFGKDDDDGKKKPNLQPVTKKHGTGTAVNSETGEVEVDFDMSQFDADFEPADYNGSNRVIEPQAVTEEQMLAANKDWKAWVSGDYNDD